MATLDDFFRSTTEPLHPRLRDWKQRLSARNASASLEIFRPKTDLGPGAPEMYVRFFEGERQTHADEVPWDDDLNAGLIGLHVRAASVEHEAERTSLGLRAAMRKPEREFGDSYCNAVLLELIKDSHLDQHKEIADVIKYAYANAPYREGGAMGRYNVCRELIADTIGGRAKELTHDLRYSTDEAKQILVTALARYLDERFSVSARRDFGML